MKNWKTTLIVILSAAAMSACATTQSASVPDQPKAVKSETLSSQELVKRGDILASNGMYLRAEQYYGAALKQGYPKAKLIPRLVKVCISGSHYNAALQHALPYLNAHPGQWQLRQLVALILIATGEHEKAKNELSHVLRDMPTAAFSHFVLASLLRDHFQDDNEAIQHFSVYLELEPTGMHAEEAQNSITLLRLAQQSDSTSEDKG